MTQTNLRPLHDRVIVKLIEMADTTPNGILIPEAARGRSHEALVLAVGPGQWHENVRIPIGLSVGDRVLLAGYAGVEIEWGGGKVVVVEGKDILAIVSYGGEGEN